MANRSNQDLLDKAETTLRDLVDGAGKLTPAQAAGFVKMVTANSVISPEATVDDLFARAVWKRQSCFRKRIRGQKKCAQCGATIGGARKQTRAHKAVWVRCVPFGVAASGESWPRTAYYCTTLCRDAHEVAMGMAT